MFSESRFSRRDFFRTGAAAALGAVLGTPSQAAEDASADFHFVVANDLHYRDPRCGPWMEKVAASIRSLRPRPAFVMLAGDLSESGTREQLGAMREIFWSLPMPVRAVIGNHDYTAGDNRAEWEKLYGRRRNYRFDCRGWQFLALDTTEGSSVYRTRVSSETLGWLDGNLTGLKRGRPTVILTHFPLGRNWLRPTNANAILDRLKAYQLRAALSGHWHGITEREEAGAHLSTGRCCSWWRNNHDGSPLKGYMLCRVRDGRIAHEFVAVESAETSRA